MTALPVDIEKFAASNTDTAHALSLPPEVYTSPEFFDFEMEAIFAHEWVCVGRVSDIPKTGDYFTTAIGKDPIIILRGRDGQVHAYANVCQHRAMPLVEGSGNTRRFRCPYHSWVYGLDGCLQSAPDLNDADYFDKSEIKLPEVRVDEWLGFVFITFDETLPPVSQRLGRLAEQLAPWNIGELEPAGPLTFDEYDFNWKLLGDECYHCAHLHSQSWVPMYPTSSERIDFQTDFNDEPNGVVAYELISVEEGAAPTKTGRVLQPYLPGLNSLQRSRLVYVTVAPNMLIIAMPDKVKYFLWLPDAHNKTRFAATWMYPRSTLDLPNFEAEWKQELEDLAQVMREDEQAWNGCQRGMASRFAPRGRYAPSEEVLVRLNRWLIEKYTAEQGRRV